MTRDNDKSGNLWQGKISAREWLTVMNQTREQAAIVATLDPFQAYRVGFSQGGLLALDYVQGLIEERGASAEYALELCRAYWRQQVSQWVNAPTQPGQEIVPLIPMEEQR